MKISTFFKKNKRRLIEIMKISFPTIIDLFAQTLLTFFDMMMVARLGTSAISAVSLGGAPIMFIIPAFHIVSVGTTAILSRSFGANDKKGSKNCLIQSLLLSIPIALIVVVLMFTFRHNILALLGRSDDIDIKAATQYFNIAIIGLIATAFNFVFSFSYRSIGKTTIPMFTNLIVIVCNVVLNYIFIFVLNMGVLGASIATTIAIFSRLFIFSYMTFFTSKYYISLKFKEFKIDKSMMFRILKIGFPASLEQFLLRFGMLTFEVMIISLGSMAYASHKIASNAEAFSFNLGFGFSFAAVALVGKELGKGNVKIAEYNAKIVTIMAVILMGIFGIIFFTIPGQIISLFTNEAEIKTLASGALRIVSVCQPFLAVSMVLNGCLRGTGDTKSVLIITIIGIFFIRIPATYFCIYVLKTGLLGAWAVMSVDLIFRSCAAYYAFKKGKWREIKV